MVRECPLGCPNIHSSQGINVPLKYVIMYGIKMHYVNFQSFPFPFTIRKLHSKYTKKILKNTREKASWISFLFFRPKTIVYVIQDEWLHSLGPNGSFDTCIVIYMTVICYMSFMS